MAQKNNSEREEEKMLYYLEIQDTKVFNVFFEVCLEIDDVTSRLK